MWSYYGTKKKIAKYYPSPEKDIIIEPFCGAAQYSLFGNNWQKQVYLIDKYDVIINIWKYLIQVSQEDILKLPDMYENDNVNNYTQLIEEERNLIGFCINSGSSQPKKTVKKFNSWNKTKKDIANNLHKIRHWKVKQDDYFNIKNVDATWYIDPPYQYGGEWYRISNKTLDYIKLAQWCKERKGQVIVCENTKANWMDFKPLVELNGQLHKTTEAIWYRSDRICGACGSTDMVDGYFYNKEKDIKLRLCDVCAKTAQLNGYFLLNVTNREQALKTVGHIF